MTYKWELKFSAAWTLLHWKRKGIDELYNSAINNPSSNNIAICILILISISANILERPSQIFCNEKLLQELRIDLDNDPGIAKHAREKLINIVISLTEQELNSAMMKGFNWLIIQGPNTVQEFFIALSFRWLTINIPLLNNYERLIHDHPKEEAVFQDFFTKHPQFLDPMAVEVWPLPNLRGAKKPDFVIRRFDNSYLVVEIETPEKSIITKHNVVAATTTQAVSQAIEYRRFIKNMHDASIHFPELDDIHCLVVIGLEKKLGNRQKQALRNDNAGRKNLRVVGFDWLSDRVKSVHNNLAKGAIPIRYSQRF